MANARCNTAFSQGGYSAQVGEIIDTSHYLYLTFPTFFDVEPEPSDTLSIDVTFAGTFGPVITSDAGSLFRIAVNDGGTLSTTEL